MSETCHICLQPLNPHPLGEKEGYKFVACKACGSAFVYPRITKEQRDAFLGEVQPEATHIPDYKGEIEHIKKRLNKIVPEPHAGKRFLDADCRNGYAVVAATQLGMKGHGIDVHDYFIRFAQTKYDASAFTQASPLEYAESGAQTDVLYAFEAFCEQTDLESFTKGLSQLLAPGGMLYIEEPDGNNFNLPRNFTSWPIVYPPLNMQYLSRKGLTALLQRHGFTVQKIFFTWRPYTRLIATKT